jgi:hypothetical protein
MNMKIKTCLLVTLIAGLAGAQIYPLEHQWSARLKAVDDNGVPVTGAKIRVSYSVYTTNQISGLTDTNGSFVATHHDATENLSINAEKQGYYPFSFTYYKGDYQPARWNPNLTVLLRKIGKPIAMYAQRARIEVPELGKPIGFDLMEGDWVAPYGHGKTSDFIFEAQRRFNSWQDFDSSFSLTFHSPDDGLFAISMPLDQGSTLRLPAVAPKSGYATELSGQLSDTPSKAWETSEKKDQNYYFRVRTVKDDGGNIVSAHYGKIYGDFKIDAINSKTLLIFFQYYLNPTPNSHNVEFDPKQNLFHQLSNRQLVNAP